MVLLEMAYPTVAEIDDKLIGSINDVMCKAQCPCSPKGLLNLDKFDQDLADKFLDSPYFFTGTITNFYECYEKLLEDGEIEPINNRILKNIQELESHMEC